MKEKKDGQCERGDITSAVLIPKVTMHVVLLKSHWSDNYNFVAAGFSLSASYKTRWLLYQIGRKVRCGSSDPLETHFDSRGFFG